MSEVLVLTIWSSFDKRRINPLNKHQITTATKKHIKYTPGLSIARNNKMLNRIELTSDISKHFRPFPMENSLLKADKYPLILLRKMKLIVHVNNSLTRQQTWEKCKWERKKNSILTDPSPVVARLKSAKETTGKESANGVSQCGPQENSNYVGNNWPCSYMCIDRFLNMSKS